MDPINSIGQIAQILRRKLANRTDSRNADETASRLSDKAPADKVSPEEIRRKISARIQSLDIEERQGPKAALIFIESIIVWEFGEELLEDPKFSELSKSVLDSFSADTNASAKLNALLTQL